MTNDKTKLFERGNLFRSVLSLTLPSVLGQIILVIYNLADTFFIGLTQNNGMIAAVTLCMPAFMFLSALSNLFGVGGEGAISRCLGLRDRASAAGISAFSIWGCTLAAVLYCAAVYALRSSFIDLLGGSDPAVHAYAERYLLCSVVLFGIPTALSMLFSHLLRAEGRAVLAAVGIAGGGLLNILLDPLFMFRLLPPGNEIFGAALATGISNLLSCVYYLIVLTALRRRSVLTARLNRRSFSTELIREIIVTGGPACLMTLCENISYAVLDKLVSFAGTVAQAGVGVAKKVNMLPHCIVRGISQGVLPMIAYNYAFGDHSRMKKTLHLGTLLAVGSSLLCTAVCLTQAGFLCGIFLGQNSASNGYASAFLRILCLGCPFSAGAYMLISFFQAVGKGHQSLCLALLRKGILDIPMMLLLYRFAAVSSVVWATPAADLLCCAAAALLFVRFRKRLPAPAPAPHRRANS